MIPRVNLRAGPFRALTACLLTLFAVVTATPAAAQLQWETTEVKEQLALGQAKGEAVFRFENTGTYPVTIRSTSSSCGCTTAQLDKKLYYPGDKGEITAHFKVGNRTGPVRNTIQVVTNDPQTPSTSLVYAAEIPALVTITPRLLRWKAGAETAPQVVRVQLHPEAEIELKGVDVDNENFTANLLPGEGQGEFLLELAPRETNSPQRAIISLQTEPKLENRSHFSFYAYVR